MERDLCYKSNNNLTGNEFTDFAAFSRYDRQQDNGEETDGLYNINLNYTVLTSV